MKVLGFFFVTVLLSSAHSHALPIPPLSYRSIPVSPNVTLNVALAGPINATPVVLLHGFPGGSWLWAGLLQSLQQYAPPSNALRLIIPDQRGYNRTTIPSAKGDYDINFLVADIVALIAALSPQQKVHLVGHNWGGMIAWTVAGRHPGLLQSLTVLNGPHPSVFVHLLITDIIQRRASQYIFGLDDPLTNPTPQQMLSSLGNASWLDSVTVAKLLDAWSPPRGIQGALNWFRQNICDGCLSEWAMEKTRLDTKLIITVPTLVLWGQQDEAFNNPANLDGLSQYVSPLKIVTKPFAANGHWLAQEVPEKVAKEMLAFYFPEGASEGQDEDGDRQRPSVLLPLFMIVGSLVALAFIFVIVRRTFIARKVSSYARHKEDESAGGE